MSENETPRVVRGTTGAWPWESCKANPGAWCEMSQEHADYCLEVLPPIYFRGGFAVSEPITHTSADVPVYGCCAKIGGAWFFRESTIRRAQYELGLLLHSVAATVCPDGESCADPECQKRRADALAGKAVGQ